MANDRNGADLQSAISDLRKTKLKLLALDEEQLTDEQRNELADILSACNSAIRQLEDADLANLSAAFAEQEQDLIVATSELANDLDDLNRAVDILSTVSSALGTITGIVALL